VFAAIDWQRPWLAPLRELALPLLSEGHWRDAFNCAAKARGLVTMQGHPIRFVPQQSLPLHTVYEAYIHATGAVPTRENLHDFFNALIWLRFPHIKRTLNAVQATEIQSRLDAAVLHGGDRGKQRDAATLLDENAALVVCSEATWIAALRCHDWKEALLKKQDVFHHHCAVFLFGHALLEKLVRPYKAITAHAWVLVVAPSWFAQSAEERLIALDLAVATQLSTGFASRHFTPLPVLGVPGWWPQQDTEFYDDASVFRPMPAS
jgi:hypothetical protein